MWEEFTQSIHTFTEDKRKLAQHTLGKKKATLILIPSIRFTKLIIFHLQRLHNFHPRPESPLHLPTEEPVLAKKSKPAPAKPKEKKRKLVSESSEDQPLAKRAKVGKVVKKRSVISSSSYDTKGTCQLYRDVVFSTTSRQRLQLGDQFLNDKPSEADNEKTTADTESESMVSVTIQQNTSIIPPMTSPVIDLVSRPDSPNVHWPLPTTTTTIATPPPPTTTTTTTTTTLPLPPQP
ncbi:hypothetical protein Tco_0909620 [Tanacetum coccineum]|uniref:Uncharacterized protein n=1 Tax=Tanacetum coccineum TaxID=301880 RepID=A0ABQ5CQN3_9ASTR